MSIDRSVNSAIRPHLFALPANFWPQQTFFTINSTKYFSLEHVGLILTLRVHLSVFGNLTFKFFTGLEVKKDAQMQCIANIYKYKYINQYERLANKTRHSNCGPKNQKFVRITKIKIFDFLSQDTKQ